MAGIYFHIPFCRKKCAYCDFYKTTELSLKGEFLEALKKEMELRKDYINGESVETVYFGGGTPSVLSPGEIGTILKETGKLFRIEEDAEITMEANPDDLSPAYLKEMVKTPVNRLSIGIQSFFDDDLKLMNRRHNSIQSQQSVKDAKNAGFENISIDLIYGLPGLDIKKWEENLKKVFLLTVNHLSAYHLTYHKGTRLYSLLKKGILREIPEEESLEQFEMLVDMAGRNGFDHYEISNFAKNEKFSHHNLAYWFLGKYLGLGPSAHSYDAGSRQWNIPDVRKYIQQVIAEKVFFKKEILTKNEHFNEYLITRLRTKWGISKEFISINFGPGKLQEVISGMAPFLAGGYAREQKGFYILTQQGLFISDKIMEALIQVEY